MLYQDLVLPTRSDRPFFYANFVQSIDGKVQVQSDPEGYWPIGSEEDYRVLVLLRSHTDVLVHGKGTAHWGRTLDRLGSTEFQQMRRQLGKTGPFTYLVISAHPDDKLAALLAQPPADVRVILVTTESASLPSLDSEVEILRLGKDTVPVDEVSNFLHKEGKKQVLLEGGPHTFTPFLENKLVDELFLTIAPKLFGSEAGTTISMVEGRLFSPTNLPKGQLVTWGNINNEVFLRYQLSY